MESETFSLDSAASRKELIVDSLLERFNEERRAGKNPSIDEYAAQYPEYADEIRDLLKTSLLLASCESSSFFAQARRRASFTTELERLKNYRIIRKIGEGGMGVVYEAFDETLKRSVALKVMKLFPGDNSETIARFEREAKLAASLYHPNLVPVFGSWMEGDVYFYVMLLVEGHSLSDFLASYAPDVARGAASKRSFFSSFAKKRRFASNVSSESASSPEFAGAATTVAPSSANGVAPALAAAEDFTAAPSKKLKCGCPTLAVDSPEYFRYVCKLGIQAAKGLHFAHQNKILHRDIKPGNMIVDDEGFLHITDFGLAKTMDDNSDLTRAGDFAGTWRYAAPEAFAGDGKTTEKSDIYSLGLTLCELLTFRQVFANANLTERRSGVGVGNDVEREKIHRLLAGARIPRDLQTIVLKATDSLPAKRYATAQDLADDLSRFLADEPIKARRVGAFELGVRWCRRNPFPGA
ncbi:MAG: serine/threonine protein kinase [Thermoguttaceae bacterium]|nr:serine/threonine protein kinase [Thermoguttaceae bacterium]